MLKIKLNLAASIGIGLGTAYLVKQKTVAIDKALITGQQKKEESDRFLKALKNAGEAIKNLVELDQIFSAHLEILNDDILKDSVLSKINKENKNAEYALYETCSELVRMFDSIEDEYLKERKADIKDVCERIIHALSNKNYDLLQNSRDDNIIVVADELSPSQVAVLDLNRVKGFITRTGGITSHVSIIARNNNIPAFVGLGDKLEKIKPGDFLILDSIDNEIIINPSHTVINSFKNKAKKYYKDTEAQKNYLSQTADGKKIIICANAESHEEIKLANQKGFDGIGLFRSEFFFMQREDTFPDEEEQFNFYREAAILCNTRKLVIRTFDIGGDKPVSYLLNQKESNPFMGLRGIRLSLSLKKVFKTHLRAILRASAFGNIKIMFPMIVSLEEFIAANQMVHACMEELTNENIPYDKNIETGAMIETPAAVMIAEDLAKEAAFFSIGTNDLTQYMLAVDRGNPLVSHICDTFHPALLRSIKKVIDAAKNNGINVSMCGEFASNIKALPVLLGMGLTEISIGVNEINAVTNMLSSKKYYELEKNIDELLKKSTIGEIKDFINLMY
ncbi:MAG: phosphoenolpyruvate--protein phosphotransferase [Bacteroidales bacterium]|nr:phosphoenolpyruvate--protein phosphotransferase [Bacteroidales bacterium]